MREYTRLFFDKQYLCIETPKNRYVLDYIDSKRKDYSERRVLLLADKNKPYSLYPINKVVRSIGQLISVRYKHKLFYTGESIVSWNKQKFYPVVRRKILETWRTERGHLKARVDGNIKQVISLPDKEPTSEWVGLVHFNRNYYFLEYGERGPRRVKI